LLGVLFFLSFGVGEVTGKVGLSIVIPVDITKESLENTMKSIVDEKSRNDNDIDEILIFAYDDNNDNWL